MGYPTCVPDLLYLNSLNIIVPNDAVRSSLVSLVLKALPTVEQLVPGITYPTSSKNFYVHPDGIFGWATHDHPRPSGQEERESRFVIRNIRPTLFVYLMNTHHKIAVDPLKMVERLISVSLKHRSDVPDSCKSKGGLYTSEISSLRIMTDEVKLTRFIRGEWLGSFRLDRLSLYDFMPVSHLWFDYLSSSRDTLTAFRNFIRFLTWLFGDNWLNSFSDDIAKWESLDPWCQCEPWILHLSLDKAISSWITDCNVDASVFRYTSVETSWLLLEYYLDIFLAEDKLSQLEKSYNRTLSAEVVFPNSHCKVPVGIPSIRCAPKFGSSQPNTVSVPKTIESSNSSAILPKKDLPMVNSSTEDRSDRSAKDRRGLTLGSQTRRY